MVYVQAQERPPIEIYLPSEYSGDNQNWSISQSDDKFIYVANNKGLLEFNGAKWAVYPSNNLTITRAVKVIDSLIYTGSYKDFGYWKRNKFGKLNYVSLSEKLNISFLEDEEIWNIIALDDWVLFQTLQRIYLYNKKDDSYSIINSDATIYKLFKVDESVYYQNEIGLFDISNGTSKLISNNIILKENRLVNMFNHKGQLLIQTEDNGFYLMDNNGLDKWEIPANKTLSNLRIYSSIKLRDNSFLLGSISNGMIHLSADGVIKDHISQENGLSNNTVLSVFEDVENNIWLGLENGINCINIKSPFRVYKDEKGNIGAVNASILQDEYLYLGTNQGLFYKKLKSNGAFSLIDGTKGAVWSLIDIGGDVFCGHNSGTFIVKKNKVEKVANVLGTWKINSIENHSNLLLQGNYNGLHILERKNGVWGLRNKIEGFDVSSRYVEMFDNRVFVSHEYKGVFKLNIDDDFKTVLKVEKDTSVAKGANSSLIKYKGKLAYAKNDGVYGYSNVTHKFVRDSVLSGLFNEKNYTSGKLVFNSETNKLWSFSLYGISYLAERKLSNTPKINKISLTSKSRSDISGYENIMYLKDNIYLYGTSYGYIVINLDKVKPIPHQVNINSVLKGAYKDGEIINEFQEKDVEGSFKNNENNITFNYSIAEYDKYLVTEYQYKLDGIYNEWSHWSVTPSVLFENLPYGDYRFSVRARVGVEITDNIESYTFCIDRPWYLSIKMLVAYVLFIMLFSLFMHNIYKRHYRIERERLLLKKQRELELKELENRQQLMRFNNDNLRKDIENKNRELGISTMSLIKKNEFLNTLKKELVNAEDNKSIKQVIKIIDRNLKNNDDWHTFEEAFNNADKDFLKKIKTLHPVLTSNDLRLCAYLRLNLSSKEIAPLLNISARSVEVKRYRLRKKMNLAHEAGLSDHILGI
ncbi:MAG: LuxR C-terminal-related transcriptional regulator [Algibacter sp.]